MTVLVVVRPRASLYRRSALMRPSRAGSGEAGDAVAVRSPTAVAINTRDVSLVGGVQIRLVRQQAIKLPAGLDRIGTVLEGLGMVSLDPDFSREGTERILAALHAAENVTEVEARPPSELLASAAVDVDAIDAR